MSDSDVPVGRTLGKKFLVRRLLGRGGMGVVYEVEHLLTKRIGALKLLHSQLAAQPRTVERFVREASAAGRIGSPQIVETFDAGELPSGEPYLFMELLDGCSLRELIASRGPLPAPDACAVVGEAAQGLAAAHAAGIVHRDIKPENLFLTHGAEARLKILDFGISKFGSETDHRLTAEGAPMGTPYYMAPEQVAGKRDADARVDVYALGVVLYECLTGRVPFDAPSLPALGVKILEGRYVRASERHGGVPPELDQVLARAMAVEPSRRFPSARDLEAALHGLRSPKLPALPRELFGFSAPAAGPRAELDVTAELQRDSYDALAERPRAGQGATAGAGASDANESTPPASVAVSASRGEPARPARRLGSRGVLLAAGLAVLGVAFAVPALRSRDAEPQARDKEPANDEAPVPSLPAREVPPPAVSSAEPAAAPPAASLDASRSVTTPAPIAVPRRAPAAPRASARTRAARDGLSEENPFAE